MVPLRPRSSTQRVGHLKTKNEASDSPQRDYADSIGHWLVSFGWRIQVASVANEKHYRRAEIEINRPGDYCVFEIKS